jgi:hypothetical protein
VFVHAYIYLEVAVADKEKVKLSPKKRKCRGERGWRVDGERGEGE